MKYEPIRMIWATIITIGIWNELDVDHGSHTVCLALHAGS